jgi:conjugal transfer pilus assembly protein TraE
MKFTLAHNQLEKIFAQRNGYMMLAIGSMAVCLLQIIFMFFMMGRERIILIPPGIEKTFWVSASQISPEYLSEMTSFFASLRLNVTPDNAAIQRDTILRYTDPAYYNTLKSQLVQEADKLTDQHISFAFYPVTVKVDAKHFKAIIEGDLKSFVGEAFLPTTRVKYLVSYRYDGGRLLVKSFEEVKENA